MGMGMAMECTHFRNYMSCYVTIRKDDAFTLNCRPMVPMGCEEQIGNAKCTRPFFSCEGAGTQTIKQLDSISPWYHRGQ